jgi:hypothetical protein
MFEKIKSFGHTLGTPLFTLFFLLCIFTRAKLADIKVGDYLGDHAYILKGCLYHDLPLFLCFILLNLFVSYLKNQKLRRLIKGIQFACVGFYVFDLLVIYVFNLRLYSEDLFKYFLEAGGASFLFLLIKEPFIVLLFGSWLSFGLIFLLFANPTQFLQKRIVIVLCFFGFLVGFFPTESRSPTDWIMRNFIEVNLSGGVGKDYSDDYKKKNILEKNRYTSTPSAKYDIAKTDNIIILIVEGLSNWQSKAISGLADLTPNVDRIVKENTLFENFYANGYSTEGGLISLFSGEVPIPPPWQISESAKFKGFGDDMTVPNLLKDAGYRTEFFTTGDLNFTNKDSWLLKIGFDYIEGHDSPFYDGLKRVHFNAASDKYLYNRVLMRLDELKSQKYCLVIETVSSHQPFTNPYTGELTSIDIPFRFADEMLGIFYDALKNNDFFHNGVLFIVGDHRSMTPLVPGEYQMYGESSTARVPFIIADGGRSGGRVVVEPFQQTDLLYSLMPAFSGLQIDSPFHGNFLSDPLRPPEYILHARGDDRSLVSVFSAEDQATVKLKGDETHVIAGYIDDADLIVRKINHDRIKRQ